DDIILTSHRDHLRIVYRADKKFRTGSDRLLGISATDHSSGANQTLRKFFIQKFDRVERILRVHRYFEDRNSASDDSLCIFDDMRSILQPQNSDEFFFENTVDGWAHAA